MKTTIMQRKKHTRIYWIYNPGAIKSAVLRHTSYLKALSKGRGLGEGKSIQQKAYLNPLIPSFSLGEKESEFLSHRH